jgi:tetratricopeptide (TPR) repeat protein
MPDKSYRLLLLLLLLLWLSCEEKKEVVDKQAYWDIIMVRTMGLAYLDENKLPEAEAEFHRLVELAPDRALGYANLGLVYLRMENYPEAENQLLKAIEKDPNDPDIRLILVKVYELSGARDRAIEELLKSIGISPDHLKSLYSLAELYDQESDGNSLFLREKYLLEVVKLAPANIVPKLQLIEILLKLEKSQQALQQLEEIQQQFAEFPKDANAFYDRALGFLRASNTQEATKPTLVFHNFLKLTPQYQSGMVDLKGPGGPWIGFPIITVGESFSPFALEEQAILGAIRFTDATTASGLDIIPEATRDVAEKLGLTHLTVGDYDGDGDQDLYFGGSVPGASKTTQFLFRNDFGRFKEVSKQAAILHSGKESSATFADYDNDGHLDLYIVREGPNILYRNTGEGKFIDVTKEANIGDNDFGYRALFFDMDHEGDLDLFLANQSYNSVYRNNSDGTFIEKSTEMNIAGENVKSLDAAFGDFDDDGDIDLIVINEDASNVLYTNLRQGNFEDISVDSGIKSQSGTGAVAVGDYNNDGYLDLFFTALDGGDYQLFRNKGDGCFKADKRSNGWFTAFQNITGFDADFFDFDNDGFLDLLVVGQPLKPNGRGVLLFHNDGTGKFEDVSDLLPEEVIGGRQMAIADYNEDGDLDIFIAGLDGKVHLLRNDGGNANNHVKIQLIGLRTGSGKNNHFGIGAKIEIRADGLYQMKVVTEPVVHFGIGHRSKAQVVRIMWTNGVAQNIFSPGNDMDLIEEQALKGSCPFLYTWNGEEYVFVKDMMWRSALGMPLGIMGGKTSYAFPDISKEYLKIPGELLQPKDGIYSIQITEELWETVYLDKVELMVVDHPDSFDIFVDERFVPPPFPKLRVYSVGDKWAPRSARDGKGNDLLSLVVTKDDQYVSNFERGKYQGITEMKDLILDLGPRSQTDSLFLFLNGWIFPTDASINVAISQSTEFHIIPPYLQVINEMGRWETVIENIGFPMGKDKTIVADLSGKFLSGDRQVRLRTNMEIYWDYIYFSNGNSEASIRYTPLTLTSADLHYRGYSRMYRKGGPYGPHWFDYEDVSVGQKWRDLIGNYTRYGDVQELLLEGDDKYIIANAGDEVTIGFDATQLPQLPPRWRRDFLIYSEGWVKDGDLNTAYGKTVLPLPFRAMTQYPYGEEEFYPSDPEHTKYLKKYNTRKVTTEIYQTLIQRSL